MRSLLEANLDAVRQRIAAACRAAGRSPGEVDLLAVTKSVSPPVAALLCELGQHDLGENRPGPFGAKYDYFEATGLRQPRWHWIGHLQRNKARRVLQRASVVHSIDSDRLLETVGRLCAEEPFERGVYCQVKLTDEDTKDGIAPDAVAALAARCAELPLVRLLGLMTMAPRMQAAAPSARRDAARRTFAALRELAEGLDRAAFENHTVRLSMGMSGDLEEAVLEGSHVVRVGSALFAGLDAATGVTPDAGQNAAGDQR